MKIKLILLATSILALAAFSCRNQGSDAAKEQLPEEYQGFAGFYERFHNDSAYQMEHIIFPLEGLPREADSTTIASGSFRWQRDSWKIQRPFGLQNSSYEQQLIPVSEDLIIEKITHKSGGMSIQRRFARFGDEWFLIYYADLNQMKKKGNINIEGGF